MNLEVLNRITRKRSEPSPPELVNLVNGSWRRESCAICARDVILDSQQPYIALAEDHSPICQHCVGRNDPAALAGLVLLLDAQSRYRGLLDDWVEWDDLPF